MAFAKGRAFAILNSMAEDGNPDAQRLLKNLKSMPQDEFDNELTQLFNSGKGGSSEKKGEPKKADAPEKAPKGASPDNTKQIAKEEKAEAKFAEKNIVEQTKEIAKGKPTPKEQYTTDPNEFSMQYKKEYAKRVSQLESEGMDTSDAQGVADAEIMQGEFNGFFKNKAAKGEPKKPPTKEQTDEMYNAFSNDKKIRDKDGIVRKADGSAIETDAQGNELNSAVRNAKQLGQKTNTDRQIPNYNNMATDPEASPEQAQKALEKNQALIGLKKQAKVYGVDDVTMLEMAIRKFGNDPQYAILKEIKDDIDASASLDAQAKASEPAANEEENAINMAREAGILNEAQNTLRQAKKQLGASNDGYTDKVFKGIEKELKNLKTDDVKVAFESYLKTIDRMNITAAEEEQLREAAQKVSGNFINQAKKNIGKFVPSEPAANKPEWKQLPGGDPELSGRDKADNFMAYYKRNDNFIQDEYKEYSEMYDVDDISIEGFYDHLTAIKDDLEEKGEIDEANKYARYAREVRRDFDKEQLEYSVTDFDNRQKQEAQTPQADTNVAPRKQGKPAKPSNPPLSQVDNQVKNAIAETNNGNLIYNNFLEDMNDNGIENPTVEDFKDYLAMTEDSSIEEYNNTGDEFLREQSTEARAIYDSLERTQKDIPTPQSITDSQNAIRSLVNEYQSKDDIATDVFYRVGKAIDKDSDAQSAINKFRENFEKYYDPTDRHLTALDELEQKLGLKGGTQSTTQTPAQQTDIEDFARENKNNQALSKYISNFEDSAEQGEFNLPKFQSYLERLSEDEGLSQDERADLEYYAELVGKEIAQNTTSDGSSIKDIQGQTQAFNDVNKLQENATTPAQKDVLADFKQGVANGRNPDVVLNDLQAQYEEFRKSPTENQEQIDYINQLKQEYAGKPATTGKEAIKQNQGTEIAQEVLDLQKGDTYFIYSDFEKEMKKQNKPLSKENLQEYILDELQTMRNSAKRRGGMNLAKTEIYRKTLKALEKK